jgi:hypothetical protein
MTIYFIPVQIWDAIAFGLKIYLTFICLIYVIKIFLNDPDKNKEDKKS